MNKYIINIILLVILGVTATQAQTLDKYFKEAAENNPGLESKYKEFEAALQKVHQVNSLPDPTVSFSYFIPKMHSQSAAISLTQMFPWFGTLSAQGNAAALMAEAQYQSFLDAQNQLYYEVSAAYYPLYELNRMREIEQKNIDILKSYKSVANSKFKNGLAPMVDVLRVDIMLKDAVTNLSILKMKEKPLKTTFNKLLNRDVAEEVTISSSLASENLQDSFRRDSLETNNPLLNALDLKIKASEASEIAAQKDGLPKLGVGLDYAIMADGKNIVMPMVSVSIPIFRKKYKAAQKEAQLMQESYTLQKREVANSLISNYEMTWFEIQQQKELIHLYEQQTKESNQSLNLLFSAYSNSGKDFEEVLRMQQQLLKYEKMKATAEVEYHIALAKLNYITAKHIGK
ncbi:MAG: TolC family protein [Bacteroidales bacterium]|nr:TolC family protein [Bacteroidales bacterium]